MSEEFPISGRIAGIDYGTVRIGIAVTDPDRRFASPLETYNRRDKAADALRFQKLVKEERLVGFIVGLPVHASGDESEKSREARNFGRWLTENTAIPVQFFDERFTTAFANEILGQAKLTSKRRKERRDMLAAQILLSAYLESSTPEKPSTESLDD